MDMNTYVKSLWERNWINKGKIRESSVGEKVHEQLLGVRNYTEYVSHR